MPYKSNDELPDGVKKALPSSAQSIWRNAFNSAETKYPGDESRAARIAWGAVKNAGWTKDAEGNWRKQATEEPTEEELKSAFEKAVKDDEEEYSRKDHAAQDFDAEIFAVGKWNGDEYTRADLEEMVANFAKLRDRVKPPVKLGHNEDGLNKSIGDGQPAYGWVSALRMAGDKLVATLTGVPDVLMKAIQAGRYKRVSSEIYWNLKEKGGKIFRRVLGAVALLGTDIPAVTSLDDVKALLSHSTGDEPGSYEFKRAYGFESSDGWGITEGRRKDKDMDKDQRITDLERENITLKAEKTAALDRESDQKTAAFEAKKRAHKEVFIADCNTMVQEGILLPALRNMLVDGLETSEHSYSDTGGYAVSWTQFKLIMSQQKKIVDNRQHGRKDNDEPQPTFKSAGDEVDAKTQELMGKEKISYQEAIGKVFRAYPELTQRYMDEAEERGKEGKD